MKKNVIAYDSRRLFSGYALSRSPCDTSIVWHDARCKTAPCWLLRTTMSPKRFSQFPLLVSRKTKVKETKSKVSNEHQFRLHKPLENRLRTGTVSDWKRSSDRLGNEGVYLCGGPSYASYGDKSQGGGERVVSYPVLSLTHIWIQESSNNPREVIPSTSKYFMATGKQSLKVLQSAAAFIPVPLIREAVGVALKIMEVCEDQCEVCTKIPPRKGCEMVNNIILPEYIGRRSKGQRPER